MNVLMVTGSYPPEQCGVGDYTERLVEGLRDTGIAVELFHTKENDLGSFKEAVAGNYDIIHIQYPTIGYGYKLTPHLYSLLTNCVVTLHEFSQVNILRRISIFLFSLRSSQIVFTNSYDRNEAIKYYPWLRERTEIIPIGTNILPPQEGVPFEDRKDRIVYFGMIRPQKGIEEFLELAETYSGGKDQSFLLMGGIDERKVDYAERIKKKANSIGVELKINKTMEMVSKELQNSKYGYLHFPDGASERRGSLLAMLVNGVCTFTTNSELTPDSFHEAVTFVEQPSEVMEEINDSTISHSEKSQKAKELAKNYEWEMIASAHKNLYQKII